MDNFLAHNDETRALMLKDINCSTVDDLFKQIPNIIKEFKLSNPLNELDTQKKIKNAVFSNITINNADINVKKNIIIKIQF